MACTLGGGGEVGGGEQKTTPGAQGAQRIHQKEPPPFQTQQADGAGDNHSVGTPGGLCLIAENGDVALGAASLLEFNRHGAAGSFNGRPQSHSWSCR